MSQNLDENKDNDLQRGLEKLGFSPKEALVYPALLGLGEVGSSKIIKKTGLHGQYVYQALRGLEEAGLVKHYIKSGRKRFLASSPRIISRMMEENKLVADKLVGDLESIMNLLPEQRSEAFQGSEAYIAQEFELLESAPNNSELLIIGGQGDQFSQIMSKNMLRYENLRLKKSITVKYIGSEKQAPDLQDLKDKRKFFEYRVLPGLFTGVVNTNIWKQAINFNVYGSPVTCFTVYNPVIAGSYRQFFEALWNLSK